MKDHNPHDPVNMIGEAYENFLENTMHNLHIEDGKTPSSQPVSIRRLDHASTISSPALDQEFIKASLINLLKHAGDQTRVNLFQLNKFKRLPDEYHEGELVQAGTLYCAHCDTPEIFTLPGFLEKCKNCGHTTFRKER